MTLWQWIVSWLIWLSVDPTAADLEVPRAAAAVAAARASMLPDAPTPPAPTPVACDCGQTCVRGVWKPDGRVSQTCKCTCKRCTAERQKAAAGRPMNCPAGTCPSQSSAVR